MFKQRTSLVIRTSCSHDSDVHSFKFVDLRVINFREDQLVMKTERVIATPIERLRRNSTEVTNSRQNDVDQPIEELIHAVSAKRDHGSDRHASTHLESGDRLLSA